MENEMDLFETKDKEIKLNVSIVDDTVWLTQEQMSALFDTADRQLHITSTRFLKKEN